MSRVRNIAFIVIIGMVLILPMANLAAGSLVSSYEIKTSSQLEGRKYEEAPELDAESVASGKTQKAIDRLLSDYMPRRDGVMIYNAAMQRGLIRIAAAPFSYDVVPTFYGSDYLVSNENEAVFTSPQRQSEELQAQLAKTSEALSRIIGNDNHEHRWYFAFVDRVNNSAASPAHALVAKPADYAYYTEHFLNGLPDECAIIDLSFSDTDEYYDSFFRTDHHWRVEGAVAAYRKIAVAMGFEPLDDISYEEVYGGPFYGSAARSGLCTEFSDSLDDMVYDGSPLAIDLGGTSRDVSWLVSGKGDEDFEKDGKFANVYASYFHGDPSLLHIKNQGLEPGGVLLVVGDSYTNNMERLLAEHYRDVYIADPRYFKGTFMELIADTDPDDVLFLVSSNTLTAESAFGRFIGES